MKRIRVRSIRKQLGAATIEYALIAAAVIAISTALFSSGGSIRTAIEQKGSDIAADIAGTTPSQ